MEPVEAGAAQGICTAIARARDGTGQTDRVQAFSSQPDATVSLHSDASLEPRSGERLTSTARLMASSGWLVDGRHVRSSTCRLSRHSANPCRNENRIRVGQVLPAAVQGSSSGDDRTAGEGRRRLYARRFPGRSGALDPRHSMRLTTRESILERFDCGNGFDRGRACKCLAASTGPVVFEASGAVRVASQPRPLSVWSLGRWLHSLQRRACHYDARNAPPCTCTKRLFR